MYMVVLLVVPSESGTAESAIAAHMSETDAVDHVVLHDFDLAV